ncbi:MAG: 50S ribosomal protein L7ae-like protein [Clostridiales bacterium]|jgi:large subunit ribosomal protein L7A|nr:50S ribosomal protein L7ae-like protein [Clostridiales bacterium]
MDFKIRAGARVVGLKQSLRAIRDGLAAEVYLADDAQQSVRTPVLNLCAEKGIEPVHVPTMASLGKACGISVGASVAVSLKN